MVYIKSLFYSIRVSYVDFYQGKCCCVNTYLGLFITLIEINMHPLAGLFQEWKKTRVDKNPAEYVIKYQNTHGSPIKSFCGSPSVLCLHACNVDLLQPIIDCSAVLTGITTLDDG